MTCPFCGLDPYEYVDVGIGSVPVAVNCCEYGVELLVGGANFQKLAEMWMVGARTTIERYESALHKIAWNHDDLDAAGLVGIADEALNGPPITVECEICGKPIPEDGDDFCDSETFGFVHDSCLEAKERDAAGEAADFYHDMAGDR